MKVLYDHQIFSRQRCGGISRYFFELMNIFNHEEDIIYDLSIAETNNYYLNNDKYLARNVKSANGRYHRIIPALNRFLWPKNDMNLELSKEKLIRQDFDIFHPTYYDPYFLEYIEKKPFVLTIHDMIHEIYPEYFPLNDETTLWKKRLAEEATRIIAVSESTKKDILKFFEVSPNKISVIHHGVSLSINNINKSSYVAPDRQIPERYILYVGSREIYKNFYFFIESVAPILLRDKGLFVMCVGGGPFNHSEISFLKKFNADKKVLQFDADDEALIYLYKKSTAFVFPSLYEGFGMPLLESFACGCPAIISGSSSLPEIGANAAIYFKPKDITSLKDAIEKVIYDDDLRQKLIANGFERLKNFSWKRTAMETKILYNSSGIK